VVNARVRRLHDAAAAAADGGGSAPPAETDVLAPEADDELTLDPAIVTRESLEFARTMAMGQPLDHWGLV
jgi:hypothetical protein